MYYCPKRLYHRSEKDQGFETQIFTILIYNYIKLVILRFLSISYGNRTPKLAPAHGGRNECLYACTPLHLHKTSEISTDQLTILSIHVSKCTCPPQTQILVHAVYFHTIFCIPYFLSIADTQKMSKTQLHVFR